MVNLLFISTGILTIYLALPRRHFYSSKLEQIGGIISDLFYQTNRIENKIIALKYKVDKTIDIS